MENKPTLDPTAQTEFCDTNYEQLCIEGFFDEEVAVDYEFPTEQ